MADKPVDTVARALEPAMRQQDDTYTHHDAAIDAIAALTAPEMREALVAVVLPHLRYYVEAERVADAVMAWLWGDEPEAGR